ncbi:PadR family transcriptional regulator [Deinococcus alpinitundrae]|uniref:PadR family transcriptional regulator n=1 Tax=Deinococcus alpinitundrae TaxID=468913 RepID=UPI00137AF30C|nr:PadR family transcriptional regulator [Deinococcus alpinitundrae]
MNPASPALGPSSYIVLGLLGQYGPGTSYDLKRWADESVGNFWTFPRSQLYAEPQRLAALGLLEETQEESGRRRRTYQVSQSGRAALQDWLAQPAGFPELRDLGLLKLFFAEQGTPQQVRALAAEQLALHRARLAEYERQSVCLPPTLSAVQPLQMGLLYERASIAFWSELLS